jgi:hypothetical protein
MNQSPSSHDQIGRAQHAVETLRSEKAVVHPLHQSIEHAAGPEGSVEVIRLSIRCQVSVKLLNLVHHESWNLRLSGPFAKPTQSRVHGLRFSTK